MLQSLHLLGSSGSSARASKACGQKNAAVSDFKARVKPIRSFQLDVRRSEVPIAVDSAQPSLTLTQLHRAHSLL